MNGWKMFRQKSAKQTNAQTQAWQANKQTVESADVRCPSCKKKLGQQRQQRLRQCRLKIRLNIQPTNLARIWIHAVCLSTVRNINRICKTASKFDHEILKIDRRIVHVLSNMQNGANSRCCFVNVCKQPQRNEQRIMTHTYTAIVLVAVAVEVCLM